MARLTGRHWYHGHHEADEPRGIEYHQTPASDMSMLAHESFDAVLSTMTFMDLGDYAESIAEIARVLKPGGRMLISDIVVEDLPDWIRRSAELYNSCVAGAISEEEYLDGLRAAGLDEVEVRDRLVYDACQLSALVDSGIENVEAACCGTTLLDNATVKRALDEVAGKIWSARIFGRKP